MDVRPIKTEEDYRAMLREVELLIDAAPESEEEARLEVLGTLVEAYEKKRYPVLPPDPIEAIKYQMECRGLTNKDLQECVGGRSRVSEIMRRRRPLSIEMIRQISHRFDIPAGALIQKYPLQAAPSNTKRGRAVKAAKGAKEAGTTAAKPGADGGLTSLPFK